MRRVNPKMAHAKSSLSLMFVETLVRWDKETDGLSDWPLHDFVMTNSLVYGLLKGGRGGVV